VSTAHVSPEGWQNPAAKQGHAPTLDIFAAMEQV
jgi:hypothetical protein